MAKGQFDADAFFDSLESIRSNKKITWKKVAEESGVSASTLTRMAQGKRPDVDSLAALAAWSNLYIDNFVVGATTEPRQGNPLEEASALFRADPSLSPEAKSAIEAIVRTAHENLRSYGNR